MFIFGLGKTTLCSLPTEEEQSHPSPCCSTTQEQGKEKIFAWLIHPPYRSWSPRYSIPVRALPRAQGLQAVTVCLAELAGKTGMDLKHLLLTQEKNRLKQMDNKLANSAGTVPGNSSCNRVSLAVSCGVLMLLYS